MKKLKVKYRVIVILFLLVCIVLSSCITYSLFHSSIKVNVNQELAQFVFDARNTDHIDLNLVGLTPGDSEDYYFSVTNSNNDKLSHVTLNYKITVKTLHTIPLNITVYDVTDREVELFKCDESYSRDENNYLLCNSPVMEMSYNNAVVDRYKIKVDFPEEYSGVEYSDLVDSISVDISSWQKVS